MLPLGTAAPDFTLPGTISGKTLTLSELAPHSATVILFICNHCPFVVHLAEKLSQVAKQYTNKGVQFIAISSNDIENHPQDAPDKMKRFAQQYDFCFPYLYDESQSVAKAYDAACTPDLYVFDQDLKLAYRGRFDASRPGNDVPVTGENLRQALDDLLAGQPVSVEQIPSAGCNIKWRS